MNMFLCGKKRSVRFLNFTQLIPLWLLNWGLPLPGHALWVQPLNSYWPTILLYWPTPWGPFDEALAPGVIGNTSDLHLSCNYSHRRSEQPFTADTLRTGLQFMNDRWNWKEGGTKGGRKSWTKRGEEWRRTRWVIQVCMSHPTINTVPLSAFWAY